MAMPDSFADSNSSLAAHDGQTNTTQPFFPLPIKVIRPGCFRTDERLRCRRTDCSWREDCRRLVAEWKR